MRRSRTSVIVGVGLILLVGAWVMATKPFSAPDEAYHYLRALTITNGELLGPRYAYPPSYPLSPAQRAFADHDARTVLVPARLTPPNTLCLDGRPDTTGSCRQVTGTGDYYPPAYFAPAAALAVAGGVDSGVWLARGACALVCLAFLLLAVALLATDSGWSLVGLLAATTPMVLFVGSVINPSGLEVAASLALAACALRLAREPSPAPHWVWIALTVGGAVTILAWQTGPLFALADLLPAAVLLGPAGRRQLRAANRRWIGVCAVVLGAAVVLFAVYSQISGVGHSAIGFTPFFHSLRIGFEQLGRVLREAVGVFGLLSVHLPSGAHWIWWLVVLTLMVGAIWVGSRRERLVVAGVVVAALLFPVLAYAWSYRLSGFGIQGRQVLPLLALVPLVAGEVVYRHRATAGDPGRASWWPAVAIAVLALFQLFAWWINARSWAGHPSAFWFLSHPKWQPPLGWWPWAAMAALGALSLGVAAITQAASAARVPRQSTA